MLMQKKKIICKNITKHQKLDIKNTEKKEKRNKIVKGI